MPGSADRATHTHSMAETGAAAPAQAASLAQTPPPHQHTHPQQLLVLLLQLGLHLAQPLLDVTVSLFHLSAKNSVSSSRNDPVLTQAGYALRRPLAPGSWGARPHACSSSQRGFACDTWVTEGAGDRLVRGDVLVPAPGPTPAAAAPPPQTVCAEPARAGQWQARDSQEHTFYLPKLGDKFQQFSLLSDRASGRPKFRLQGRPRTDSRDVRGEKKPTLERKITGRRVPPGGC